jgi:methyl-accepting chemotaxis protein
MIIPFLKNLKIGKKIGRSFLILLLILLVTNGITLYTLNQSVALTTELQQDIYPTQSAILDLATLIKDSRSYITNWVFMQSYEVDKRQLEFIHDSLYQQEKNRILKISKSSGDTVLENKISDVLRAFEDILVDQRAIMNTLSEPADYEDPLNLFTAEDLVESKIFPETAKLIGDLELLYDSQSAYSSVISNTLSNSFESLQWRIILMALFSVLFVLFISKVLTRSITVPLKLVNARISDLRKGIITEKLSLRRRDELGSMAKSINALIDQFRSYAEFARKIGNGNLSTDLEKASEDDVLGQSLLAMRDNLHHVITETNKVVFEAGSQGKLSSTIPTQERLGAWHELSVSINELLRSISSPLLEIQDIMTRISDGDLSVTYKGHTNGDIKILIDSLHLALSNLKELLSEILVNAEDIESSTLGMLTASQEMNTNTSQIADSIAEMSLGAQKQVRQIEEVSQITENILKSAEEMETKSNEIHQAASLGLKHSDEGAVRVQEVSRDMDLIMNSSNTTLECIKILEERSNQISLVLKIITDISSQTNLLALNAAIEAAQAGQAGRGFAVVAEEVRKLAESSNQSAQEIGSLIKKVQSDSGNALKAIEHTSDLIHRCFDSTKYANESFTEILRSSQEIAELSKEIKLSTDLQRNDVKHMVNITEAVIVIAEESATGSEQIASSASELSAGMNQYTEKSKDLSEIAKRLKSGINQFKL